MDFRKEAYKIRDNISQFSGELSHGLDKTAGRFVKEGIYGILSSESVLLTEMGRCLEGDVSLKKIEERFCRQIGKEQLSYELHSSLLTKAESKIKEDTLIIVDISDVQKRYAQKMEYVTEVRDGSEGEIGNGYWTLQAIGAEVNKREVVPLYHSLYSQDSPDFKSENYEILKAIDLISSHTNNRGIYVLDRGGDREKIFTPLLKNNRRFIIRLRGDRHLIYRGKPALALDLAYWCECPYSETVVRVRDGQEKVYSIRYGYKPVKLPGHDTKLWLVVIKGFGNKPMMLITTEPVKRCKKVVRTVLVSYLRRWGIEETIRFIKQTYDLENIRVLRYVALKNMMALVLTAFYFLAVILDRNQKLRILTGHILRSSKRVFGIPNFKYYALSNGLSVILKRNPGKLSKKWNKYAKWQQTLNFT